MNAPLATVATPDLFLRYERQRSRFIDNSHLLGLDFVDMGAPDRAVRAFRGMAPGENLGTMADEDVSIATSYLDRYNDELEVRIEQRLERSRCYGVKARDEAAKGTTLSLAPLLFGLLDCLERDGHRTLALRHELTRILRDAYNSGQFKSPV